MIARRTRASERRTITGPRRRAREQPERERERREPVDVGEQREGDRRRRVGDPEQDVLERVRARQRVARRRQQHREQHDAGGRAEVAAVDADEEDRHDQPRPGGPAVTGLGLDPLPQQDHERGRRDQPRRDQLERAPAR